MFDLNSRTLAWALVAGCCIFLVSWFWLVTARYTIPDPKLLTLASALRHTFDNRDMRWIAVRSIVQGVLPVLLTLYVFGNQNRDSKRVVRGARLVAASQLSEQTRVRAMKGEDSVQINFAGVPIPRECEQAHFLLPGSTGTGKSTAIHPLIAEAIDRGDRCAVVDPNGDAYARFSKGGDTLLNPFDKRGPGWSPFNEVRKPYDFDQIAHSIVPDCSDPSSQVWHGYARQLLAETMRTMTQSGETTTDRLLFWLTKSSAPELAHFLAGSAAAPLFEPGAEKALASTRFILSHFVGPYQYVRPGDFSLRTWLTNGDGNLFLTWRQDMLTSLRPLISAWCDILIASILALPPQSPRPLWMMLDELGSMERLSSLAAGLTKGRKHGLRVVAGLQSIAQLDAIYGHHNAASLRSCFRNVLALGCSSADYETAEAIAKGLGQSEVKRLQTTHNHGPAGNTRSCSMHRTTELLVLPSELIALPPLEGFLKFAGRYPVAKVRLHPVSYALRTPPFIEF